MDSHLVGKLLGQSHSSILCLALTPRLIYSKFLYRYVKFSSLEICYLWLSNCQLKARATPAIPHCNGISISAISQERYSSLSNQHKRHFWRLKTLTQPIHRICCLHRQMRRHGRLEGSFHTPCIYGYESATGLREKCSAVFFSRVLESIKLSKVIGAKWLSGLTD